VTGTPRPDAVEAGPADAAASVIWLHGLGADGWDFFPIAAELRLPASLSVRFVFPHAPHRPVTLNAGMTMRAWYDIAALDMDERSHDAEGIRASEALVRTFVERELARGVAPGRIVLAGFSQGGAMTIHAALRAPWRLAGAIALSCYLLLPNELEGERSAASAGLPFFMGHGTEDPIVPYAAGVMARDALLAAGYPVEWRSYPIPHGVSPQEIADVGAWLARTLG
jgi:phospholipase/carboxylesterase